jgi:hypothetical protein
MALVKVLYVDANGDYTEVDSAADTVKAYGFDASGQPITNVGAGSASTDAVNYGQFLAAINGFDWKASVLAATTAALPSVTYANGTAGVGATLTAAANGAFPAQDGVAATLNARYLIKDEVAAETNGIYVLTALGDVSNPFVLTRATDSDDSSGTNPEVSDGNTVTVEQGTLYYDRAFKLTTNGAITMGTTALTYSAFAVNTITGGAGIDVTGANVSADLYTGGGIKFVGVGDAGQLAVEPSDFAGSGLVDDGSDNLAIDWSTAYNDSKAVKASDLSSTATGLGASIIGIEDAGGFTTVTTAEAALQELYGLAGAHEYTVDVGGVTIGDLVYLSGSNTVKTMPITAAHVAIGMAMATVAAAGTVRVKKFDTILAGAVSGATVDQKYYWSGTALTTTLPPASGSYVWQAGVAINATDLLADVDFIKRNA